MIISRFVQFVVASLLLTMPMALNSQPTGTAGTKRQPVSIDAQGDPLPAGALCRLGTIRYRNPAGVWRIAYSPDGKMLAIGGIGRLSFMDPATGKEIAALEAERFVIDFALAPDGRSVAWGANGDPYVRLSDIRTGKELRRFRATKEVLGASTDGVTSLAMSGDGKILAGVRISSFVVLWNVETGKQICKMGGTDEGWTSVAFSPDGKRLASSSCYPRIVIWDVASGDRICTCAGPRSDVLAFSPDGKILATADHDYDSQRRAAIRLWHTRTGKEFARLTTYGFGSGARTLVFTADGKTLLSGNDGGSVEVWDVARGTRLRQLAKHRFRVDGLALHPDGRTLACSDQNSMIRFYDLDTGRELHPTGGNHGWVRSLAFLPGGKKLVTHAADEFVRFWNIDTGKEIRKWDLMTDKIDPAAFSKDGQLLVDHKGRLWDVSSGQCRAAHQGVSDGWLSFSGNGQMAATISSRNRDVIRLWHLAHYEGVWRLRSKKNTGFWCPALSANGRTLAALDLQYQVHCFDTRSGRQLCRFPEVRSGKATGIYGLALSPDGRTAVTAGHDSPFVAWETRTGQMRAVLSNEIGLRPELAFSRDGRFLAAGEHNGTIRIWKLPAAKERRVLHQAGGVACLAFSADNQRLASGGYDTTALIWNIEDLRKGKPKQSSDLTQEQLETAWCDLAGPDAVRAYKAIGKLIAYPHQAVALFRNRLGPIDAGPQRVARLIADLDSDKFPVRHEATKALEEIGEPAVSLLKQSAAKPPSEEMRRRIDHLLRHIAAGILHPSTLRTLRALEVLEAIGTPDAISVIEKIAAGTPTALITEDAEASLERLRDPSITGYRLSADGR